MKTLRATLVSAVALLAIASTAIAQNTFILDPFSSFGGRGDGSIQPGDSIGISPYTGYQVNITGPSTPPVFDNSPNWFPGETTQDQRPTGSTNGFNMRGITYDPVSGNVIFVDTHTGSGGSGTISPYAGIYILDASSGQIKAGLTTNGITGGSYTHVCVGVATDGAVYVANQTTASQTTGFKLYRWPTADTNNPSFSVPPTVSYSSTIAVGGSGERLGETMDVRGAGTNTQIILGSSSLNGTGTNIFLFTTADGTNFTPHRISFPGITTPVFNDGIAFGPGNTFWSKQVGKPLLYLSYDFSNPGSNYYSGAVISSFTASSVNDPLLNLSAIAYDPVNHLLAGMEEIGGIATGGRGKIWLFDLYDPTNHAPAILGSRTYIPNLQKTTAPMGYLRFGNGRLYGQASNNGFLVSSVDSVPMAGPAFTTDLPATNRVSAGLGVHFEVFATPDVTNYVWYSNNVVIAGATTYFLDIPNVQGSYSGSVYKVVASNAAGSATSTSSTLLVISPANFFHLNLLWSKAATTTTVNDATNYITSSGGAGTPLERTLAYDPQTHQLLVVRGPLNYANLRIFVVNPDTGAYLYDLKTNGIGSSPTLTLCGIGVADDGAVYAANADPSDNSFKVYRWADTGSNTVPQVIFGTNSSAANGNPISDVTGTTYFRFGDALAVRGSGNNTEIIVDSQNSTKYTGILTPVPDGTMTNWTQSGYVLQNIQGSYGSEAYGTTIGRSLQFGNGATFWQKRYNGTVGAPLAQMGYTPGAGFSIAPLQVANTTPELFTNGPVGINNTLNLMAGINFVNGVANDSASAADVLDYYDITDPSQAVILSRQNLPGGNSGNHKGNSNAIGDVQFGANPITGTNYLFVINGNNGIAAYALVGGTTPPPRFLVQPANLRVLQGSSGALQAQADQPATIQWFKGTNSPVYTGVQGSAYGLTTAQLTDGGDYFAIATNVNGAATSQVAHISVQLADDNYTLSHIWTATPGGAGYPYVSSDGGANTPNERAFAYNALSNQLIVVRCPPASTAYSLWVVDAGSGSNLYTLNTSGVLHQGASEVSGSNPIDLVGAGVADDGALYICSESPNASGGSAGVSSKMFHLFRWADTGPSTTNAMVYEGDPGNAPAGINYRWGDVLAVRGSGTNTQVILNSQDGSFGAVIKPIDGTLASFTNYPFLDSAGGGSIGRSIQFGTNNTALEKRKGAALVYSSYDLTNGNSSGFLAINSSVTLGGVFADSAHNLAAGVDFIGATTTPTTPDAVALYDISDPGSPMFISHYNFPVNAVANANVICQTLIAGWKVYSLDANNGLVSYYINPPVNSMRLNIVPAGANVNLSWGSTFAILQGTTNVSPTGWTDLTTAGQTNLVQAATAEKFYRLILRR